MRLGFLRIREQSIPECFTMLGSQGIAPCYAILTDGLLKNDELTDVTDVTARVCSKRDPPDRKRKNI